jgi:hypothetical protein
MKSRNRKAIGFTKGRPGLSAFHPAASLTLCALMGSWVLLAAVVLGLKL